MDKLAGVLPAPLTLLRIGLALFVLTWIFGPYALRSAIPIWLPFLVALGLELHLLVGGLRAPPARPPDRTPQEADRERYGYGEGEELLLVRDGDEELWIPYSGESEDELRELIAEAREHQEPQAGPPPLVEHDRGGAIRRFAVGVGVIAALALTFWVVESRTGWNGLDADVRAAATARFSAEASRVAGKPVTIRCDESGEYVGAVQHADGVAVVGGELAYLTPERCLDLYRLAFKGEVRSNQTGRALAVLAHEVWHLRGVANEGITECYGLQTGVDIGRRLGMSADSARELMRRQLADNARRGRANAEYRLPPECRDGGRLDLNPNAPEFP